MPERQTLPDLLRRLRSERGLTQPELTRRAGLGAGTVAMIETGRRPNVGIDTLKKLAAALGVTVGELAEAAAL